MKKEDTLKHYIFEKVFRQAKPISLEDDPLVIKPNVVYRTITNGRRAVLIKHIEPDKTEEKMVIVVKAGTELSLVVDPEPENGIADVYDYLVFFSILVN